MKDTRPVLPFASQTAWEAWLAKNHARSDGIWIKMAKKSSGIASVSHAEALEVALCYGWIDSQSSSFDNDSWLQRFSPRRPKSKWSQINCEKVTALIAEGRMQPAGLREIESAKRDGRWDQAYASQRNMTVPADLQKKLDECPAAAEFFAGLDSKNRFAILYRVHDAKRPDTRARRIEKFVTMLEQRKKIH
jgi:uncharacterized protein YdeI (YjbR/CyaY-like superfamily)